MTRNVITRCVYMTCTGDLLPDLHLQVGARNGENNQVRKALIVRDPHNPMDPRQRKPSKIQNPNPEAPASENGRNAPAVFVSCHPSTKVGANLWE